jgi:choline dehydrogenase-like flavoprotein
MGSPDDSSAVVDPRCRFIGVEGLSVVDASVIPVIPRANIHLTAVMIAERVASFLIGWLRLSVAFKGKIDLNSVAELAVPTLG